ncbi:uncharacterized protein PADG_04481 [Paracoccidioides brasiliensis Pb18]|uniref:Only prolin and serin are matching in the corresponding protein n=1 Tax=Paracoccidioides brasiliensis (strain Pb18) TaxID=502780 RepID=C1GBV9_PARBD|nr:uncharacterized protein PADG_04481 [Paracoccidioides brasiliensis Pb18]EEH48402.1 hypothetical protein PADG_04481 [Paracoccidioides brasiliensis Pb18]
MFRLSHLFEATKCESTHSDMESTQTLPFAIPYPQSPQSIASSNSGSPAVSLFSTRTHNRFPSSSSSLASSPGLGSLSEGFSTMKTHLTDVKEEPLERETSPVGGCPYFRHFNKVHTGDHVGGGDDLILGSHEYDLSDDVVEINGTPKKRKPENTQSASFHGISRISTRFTSMSSKWKQKQRPDTAAVLGKYDESLRSRANSATSMLVRPAVSSLSIQHSHNSSSPARAIFEDRLNEAGIPGLDIDKANRQSITEIQPKATTPLLPPMMMEFLKGDDISLTQSPLQSPSVADVTDTSHPTTSHNSLDTSRPACLPSPPLSNQPSVSSISRQLAAAIGQVPDISPVAMPEPNDAWSNKLGHANFTIRPEPYLPQTRTLEALESHTTNWSRARCNYAKHLIRIREHYGLTSNIYHLTEEKWDSVDAQWRETHDQLVAGLEDSKGNPVRMGNKPIIMKHVHLVEAVKIPKLDKEKFPDLGDEDIVGPMSVAPGPPQMSPGRTWKSKNRTFFKFLRDLFSPSGVKA